MDNAMARAVVRGLVLVLVALACVCGAAPVYASSGVEHLHFFAGPYRVTPGANLILVDYNKVPKPSQDGYIVRMAPNLRYALPNGQCCGPVPMVSVIHLHHGVWLSNGIAGEGEGETTAYAGSFYPFMAVGEEKTVFAMPKGYGYPVGAHDFWVLNYMIHDLTPVPATVYITYDIDFIRMSSPQAKGITPVHPIWMDVEDHRLYPVFDVVQHSGRGGVFTFPDMAKNPYPGQAPLNEFTVMHSGTLVATVGHLHPGGLWDELDLLRPGTSPSGGAKPGLVSGSVRLFRSSAHYFDRRGPISWNMAMGATNPRDWRPGVQAGDTLRISATYDTRRASWYEVMGIMVVWEAYGDQSGVDPFTHGIDQRSHLTHGYLPENNDNGGAFSLGINPNAFPTCHARKVVIRNFKYNPGDFTASGRRRCIPTIRSGQSLTFINADSNPAPPGNPLGQLNFTDLLSPPRWYTHSIFHSITSCKDPCGLNTGISYPLANGAGFDSGQLGPATPAIGTISWSTPTSLPPGTYTFYCRIHPFMRGVFRVIG
jgi:hypothetical protein